MPHLMILKKNASLDVSRIFTYKNENHEAITTKIQTYFFFMRVYAGLFHTIR